MSDEQPRGVHLTDKEIVFGVMAASVVVVVAFLCGVFVGRGVRALRPAAVDNEAALTAVVPDAAAVAADVDQSTPVAMGPAGSSVPRDRVSYPDRLSRPEPAVETLTTTDAAPPQPPPDAPADRAEAAGATRKPQAPDGRPAPAPAGGLTVQIAAVRRIAEAQAIVDRLIRKGFPAYVYTPPAGDRAGGFRVRVGSYKSREEAEAMASRLRKEEQYKPWITR